MQIKGKNAVLIGGAEGIGYAYCNALLRKGARVYMGDIQEEKGKLTVEEFREQYGPESIYFCEVDVTKKEDIAEIFRRAKDTFGQIDITVGNAGIVDEFDWEKCLDVNLIGTIRLTYEAFKYMAKDKGGNGGVMVHTASIGGLAPVVWGPVYATTKHGIVGFCRSWAADENYSKHGIRINCICPTAVKTPLQDKLQNTFHFETVLMPFVETVDFLKIEEMEKPLIELIENEKYNGAALRVSKALGLDVATFQEIPPQ